MLVIEDADELDELDLGAASAPPPPRATTAGFAASRPNVRMGFGFGAAGQPESLSLSEARRARALLFGVGRGWGGAPWRQGLYFSDVPGLGYGLVQREGGTCGALAALQAHVLRELGAGGAGGAALAAGEVPAAQQRAALAAALVAALTRAGGGGVVVVSSPNAFDGGAPMDSVLQSAHAARCATRDEALAAVEAALDGWAAPQGHGLLLFVLSAVLSRGAEAIAGDMDDPAATLVAAHGYCTQELVNLITVGHAASGVHNGQREVDMGGSDGAVVMGGIKERAGIGFLTLFEYFKYVEVGSNLKMPKHPVWVVCSESHFTVLFASDTRAARGALPCELRYYDGLARQDAPIVLTLERHPEGAMPPEDAPPLERVLSTRWGALCVGWNGTDPIL